jgi:hypothetical protein
MPVLAGITSKTGLSCFGIIVALITLPLPARADSPAPIDACKLLSADEIATVIGKKVGTPISREGAAAEGSTSSVCIWRVAEDSDRATVDAPLQGSNYVMLNAWSWEPGNSGPAKFLQEFRDAAKNNLIDSTPVPVAVGDEGLYWGDGVAIRKGSKNFGISVHLQGGKPTEQAMETSLAKKVVGRL